MSTVIRSGPDEVMRAAAAHDLGRLLGRDSRSISETASGTVLVLALLLTAVAASALVGNGVGWFTAVCAAAACGLVLFACLFVYQQRTAHPEAGVYLFERGLVRLHGNGRIEVDRH